MEAIKLEDLYVVCSSCNGSGHYSGPPKNPGGGYGRQPVHVTGPCEDCDGKGGELTENGRVLFKFVQFVNNNPRLTATT